MKPGGYWVLLKANSRSYGAAAFRRQVCELHAVESVQQLCAGQGLEQVDLAFDGYYAPILPGVVNFLRKQCAPRPLDLYDYQSWLASRIREEERGLWLLRVQQPVV